MQPKYLNDITINARKIFEIIRKMSEGNVMVSVEDNVFIIETENAFKCSYFVK